MCVKTPQVSDATEQSGDLVGANSDGRKMCGEFRNYCSSSAVTVGKNSCGSLKCGRSHTLKNEGFLQDPEISHQFSVAVNWMKWLKPASFCTDKEWYIQTENKRLISFVKLLFVHCSNFSFCFQSCFSTVKRCKEDWSPLLILGTGWDVIHYISLCNKTALKGTSSYLWAYKHVKRAHSSCLNQFST